MLNFIADLFLKWFFPKHRMCGTLELGTDLEITRPRLTLNSHLNTCSVLHEGMILISSIIYPPGSGRVRDSWCVDMQIFLVGKDLKKVQFVGPTYNSVIGMIKDVVKTYD